MDTGCARSRSISSALKEPPLLRRVPENSASHRGSEASDYIETRLWESTGKGDKLMSVPIGDVLGIMTTLIVGFINIIVLLLMALIDAKK